MYYKNQWSAYCWDVKPLLIVPAHEILAALRVNLDLPDISKRKSYLTSDKKTYSNLYQFEIFNERTDYPYHQEIVDKTDSGEEERRGSHSWNKIDVENLESYKLWGKYEEERIKRNNSPNRARKVI